MASRPEGRLPTGRSAGKALTEARRFNEFGTANMFANIPTWTTERVELLKQHFEAGLSCREIAASIGVSRNAVIGKLTRLGLTRGPGRREPRATAGQAPRRQIRSTAAISDAASRLRERAAGRRRRRSQATSPVRCSNSARSDAAGRSRRPAPRISAFAATRRSTGLPYCAGHTRLAYSLVRAQRMARA